MPWIEPIGVSSPLPLPREYLVIKHNPVAMAKHVECADKEKLLDNLAGIETQNYLAIFRRYLEEPSVRKSWHLCELYVLHKIEPPRPDEEDSEASPPEKADVSIVDPAEEELVLKEKFPPRELKDRYYFQRVYARIRTRLCEVPRGAPHLLPAEVFSPLERLTDNGEDWDVECRKCIVQRVRAPAFQREDGDQPESEDDDDDERGGGSWRRKRTVALPDRVWEKKNWPSIYLLPHFDYSYNLQGADVGAGHLWEDEHVKIMSTLLPAVPSIIPTAMIPCAVIDHVHRKWYIEHPDSTDPEFDAFKALHGDHFGRPPVFTYTPTRIQRIVGYFMNILNAIYRAIQPVLAVVTPRRKPVVPEIEYVFETEKPTDFIFVKAPMLETMPTSLAPPAHGRSLFSLLGLKPLAREDHFIDNKRYIPFADPVAIDVEERDKENAEKKRAKEHPHHRRFSMW